MPNMHIRIQFCRIKGSLENAMKKSEISHKLNLLGSYFFP